jgi:hypothetical protein
MTQYCPSCGEEVVESLNSQDCEYLVIEEFPEIVLPTPAMVSKYHKDEWTPKKILVNELAKIHMVLQQFHVVSVYPHLPPEDGIPLDNCYAFGLEQARLQMENRKGIIILGGNLCKGMSGYELKQVQGLSGVDFLYDVEDVPKVFLPNIRTIYATGAGEFSLGLKRFSTQIGDQDE